MTATEKHKAPYITHVMKKIQDTKLRDDKPESRFLSESECNDLARRVIAMAVGGGDIGLFISTAWVGNIRFAKNDIIGGGDIRWNHVGIQRDIMGGDSSVACNRLDDAGLQAAVRRSEALLELRGFKGGRQFRTHYKGLDSTGLDSERGKKIAAADIDAISALVQTIEPYSRPKLFFDSTYGLEAPQRLNAIGPLINEVKKNNLLAAGFIQASATGRAIIDTTGRALYYPYTESQYSITVRTPDGNGSGWAGVDFSDWSRIDAEHITQVALDKCLRSQNPVAVEPGKYTAILEPQAVSDIFYPVVAYFNTRTLAEKQESGPYTMGGGETKIGLKILDERITVSADPMDPDIAFPPFSHDGQVYRKVNWIENGVLKELAYDRSYGIAELGINSGLPSGEAYRMSGGDASIEDMVASTKRGVIVTRFSEVTILDHTSLLCSGYTRDGLWLIENGKITKPIKNFKFVESPFFAFNNLEVLGRPQKVFRPRWPAIVPSAKVRDFSFTALTDAI